MEKEFINCIEDGGVKKYVIQEGTGESPQYGYSCKMHYTGTLIDGNQFDQNLQIDKPFKFALGKGQVVKGLDIGIATMIEGEKAIFQITSDYGYGIGGLHPKIPGAQTLIFEVFLIEINVPKKTKSETSIIEREEIAMNLKEQGNKEFIEQRYQKALKRYKQALDFAQYSNCDEINENLTPLRINIQLNIAQTSLNLKDFTQAIEYTTKIINSLEATKQQMVKALFRRGVARANINLLEEAQSDFNIGLEIDPNNNDLITQSSQVAKKINFSKKNEKAFYTKAFAQSSNKHDLEQNSQYSDPSNPWVYLDIQIGDEKSEKIGIELFQNHAPKTTENFINLCTGDKGVGQKGKNLHYKNSRFHRLMKNFMIQGGDFTNGDGSGGESIFGKKFDDENLKCKHLKRGYLSMANSGPNTNGSQFFIIFKETPWLDGKHVVFGVVRLNIEFLNKLEVEEVGHKDLPDRQIVILDCGLLVL